MMADGGLEVGSCEVAFMTEHTVGDIVGELFNLSPGVAEEGITGPVFYHNHGEGGNSCKVHGHGGSGSDGVGADVRRLETQSVLVYELCGGVKLGADG